MLALFVGVTLAVGAFAASDKGKAKDTVVLASQNEPTSLTTNRHNALASDYVNQIIYNGLIRIDENLNPVGDLAESWKNVSATEWVFKLKKNVFFHNGMRMTSADVVASLVWTQGFSEVKPFTLSYATKIEAVDAYTVRIVTAKPAANLLYDLANHANFIVPKALIDSGHDFASKPVGTGPYTFVSWTPSEKLEFEAFDKYHDGAPAIKHLIYKVIPEGTSRTIALQNGEVDYIIQVATTDYGLLMKDPKVKVIKTTGTTLNYMMINNEKWPFNDANFRKAINVAINKDDIVKVALNGLGSSAYAQTPSSLPGTVATNAGTYDKSAALAYLKAWGGDVAKVSFTILCSNDLKLKVGEVIQAYLGEIGINCKLESIDVSSYLSKTATGDYEAAIGGYSNSNVFTFAKTIFASDSIGGSNRSRVANKKVDALLAKAGGTLSPTEHLNAIKELSAELNNVCGVIPLYQDNILRAFNAKLGGVIINGNNENRYCTLRWLN